MSRVVILLLVSLLAVAAFSPMGKTVRSALKMGVEDLVGAPASNEIVQTPKGYWDPVGLADGKDDATLAWYRAAELKHGRVCMLASTGLIIQALNTGIIPNPAFTEVNGLAALKKVYYENPGALVQIGIAIAAVEVLTASIEKGPGDFEWDPSNIKPKNPATLADFQLKELKNGRLAMLATAGMLYQNLITDQGVFEQWSSGHIFPFGDGQGIF